MKKTNGLIKVNPSQIARLQAKAGKLVFKKSAEDELVKLINLRIMIDEVLESVKQQIQKSANQILPNFKGVEGEKVKVMVRNFGARYGFVGEFINLDFGIEIKDIRPDYKKIEDYEKENGRLPAGIKKAQQSHKVVISLKE